MAFPSDDAKGDALRARADAGVPRRRAPAPGQATFAALELAHEHAAQQAAGERLGVGVEVGRVAQGMGAMGPNEVLRSQLVGPVLSYLRERGLDTSPLVRAYRLPDTVEADPAVLLPLGAFYTFLDEAEQLAALGAQRAGHRARSITATCIARRSRNPSVS